MRHAAILLLCLALAACSGGTGKTYSYTPPTTPGGRMCVDQCRLSSGYCEESCDNADRQCVEKVQQQALKDYRKYTEEQYAAGQPMDLSLHDFERMTPCNDGQAACYNKC